VCVCVVPHLPSDRLEAVLSFEASVMEGLLGLEVRAGRRMVYSKVFAQGKLELRITNNTNVINPIFMDLKPFLMDRENKYVDNHI